MKVTEKCVRVEWDAGAKKKYFGTELEMQYWAMGMMRFVLRPQLCCSPEELPVLASPLLQIAFAGIVRWKIMSSRRYKVGDGMKWHVPDSSISLPRTGNCFCLCNAVQSLQTSGSAWHRQSRPWVDPQVNTFQCHYQADRPRWWQRWFMWLQCQVGPVVMAIFHIGVFTEPNMHVELFLKPVGSDGKLTTLWNNQSFKS